MGYAFIYRIICQPPSENSYSHASVDSHTLSRCIDVQQNLHCAHNTRSCAFKHN